MSKQELVEHLRQNKGYIKWGVERIQEAFAQDLSLDTIKECRDQAKQKKAKDKTALSKFLKEEGINEDLVSKYSVWDAPNGRNVSVQVKNNNLQETDKLAKRFSNQLCNITTPKIETPEQDGDYLGVLGLHDAHIDKVVLADETGAKEDAKIQDNTQSFLSRAIGILDELLEKGVEEVHIPVGSDFWTVNDDRNTTKRGTKQRVLVPFQKSFELGTDTLIQLIRYAAERFRDVKVIVIYGNHDYDLDFFLGMVLDRAFETTTHVTVDYKRQERKYYQYHMVGLMYAHGYHCKSKSALERLPTNFSEDTDESARIWYETRGGIRKALMGDIHHEEAYQFMGGYDSQGLSIQFMRSVGNTGKYEWDNGWTGVPKTAYGWLFNKEGTSERVIKDIWW